MYPPLPRRIATRIGAFLILTLIAACGQISLPGGGGSGQSIDPTKPVPVALLVPAGSGKATDALLARNLENAARMAVADLQSARIDLRVYQTGGNSAQAAAKTTEAINAGAKIIVGPLYGEAANAAGVAAAQANVNVLSFSNTRTIAGGNVFLLGSLFDSTAERLVGYATQQGISRYMIAHANDLQGELGSQAIVNAVRRNGGQIVGTEVYPLSQQDIIAQSPAIVAKAKAAGAQAIVLTANVGAELAILGTVLPEKGLSPADTKYIGLTRWNTDPAMLNIRGLEGGLFALPDRSSVGAFESRYRAAYGEAPHPLAGLAYDGIAAIGALVATGDKNALSAGSLTRRQGFQGTGGIFRFTRDGLNQRGLAVATIRNGQVSILSPAPRSFSGAGL